MPIDAPPRQVATDDPTRRPLADPSRRWPVCHSLANEDIKVGNSHGIIFDAALLDLAHLKAGDELNVEVHAGGTITLTPLRPRPSREEISKVIKQTMKDYGRTMKKLA